MRPALLFIMLFLIACQGKNDYLIKVTDSATGKAGYINRKGDTVISLGKYDYCFTDTFKNYALVTQTKSGIIGINRNEALLYRVFVFDNGPDYVSNGYFRIIKNNKLGYADTLGNIAIPPVYGCAFPFKDGVAKVSYKCLTLQYDDEHSSWQSNNWFYIDKTGKRLK